MTKEQANKMGKEITMVVGENENKIEVPCYTVLGLADTMLGKGKKKKASVSYIYESLKRGMPHVSYAGMKLFPKDKEFMSKILTWHLNYKTPKQLEIEQRTKRLYS